MTALLLGIDVGGTKIAFALADRSGQLVARHRRPTEPSGQPRRDVARMAEDARQLVADAGASLTDVEVVGVSVPGPFDPLHGTVLGPPNLPGWGQVPLGEWLGRELGRPVRVENDANAAALAECRFGAGRGFSHVVYLTMSTGVGAGLVLGGRIHRGVHAAAGEIGHVPVEWDGEACVCGQRGCLEAYVGGAAWTRRLREITPDGSACLALSGGRSALTPVHLVAAAREGDAFALSELERWNGFLVRGIVHVAFTLAPELVILGTIAAAAGEALCIAPVREQVRERTWPILRETLQIRSAELGDELAYRAGLCAATADEGLAGA